MWVFFEYLWAKRSALKDPMSIEYSHQDIPELDEQIQIENYRFTIIAKEENKVELVKMNLP